MTGLRGGAAEAVEVVALAAERRRRLLSQSGQQRRLAVGMSPGQPQVPEHAGEAQAVEER